ncbi:MAG TPA: hypothetical protein VGM56_23360 [Byssovorax sp.]|jgi:hypothetical protein
MNRWILRAAAASFVVLAAWTTLPTSASADDCAGACAAGRKTCDASCLKQQSDCVLRCPLQGPIAAPQCLSDCATQGVTCGATCAAQDEACKLACKVPPPPKLPGQP